MLYARVSSVRHEQDGNLARQTARLQEAAASRGYEVIQTITEQASGLNERRKGMEKLLSLIGEQAIDVVLIEYPDRLVRFGFGYLEQAFGWKEVRLEVLDQSKHQEPTQELIQDMLTIVGVRKRVETVLKECEQKEQADGTGQPHHQTPP